jgi:hypothetical protein
MLNERAALEYRYVCDSFVDVREHLVSTYGASLTLFAAAPF